MSRMKICKLLIVALILGCTAVCGVYFGPALLVASSSLSTTSSTVDTLKSAIFEDTLKSSIFEDTLKSSTTEDTHKSSTIEDRESYYRSRIHQPGPLDSEPPIECTLVMPTYRREKMLPPVLKHYCSKESIISKIVLVWNDPETPVPPSVRQLGETCGKQLRVVTTKENKLTNRFLPQNLDSNDTTDCEWSLLTFREIIQCLCTKY